MATFRYVLDKRNKKNRKDQYNLAIRACVGNRVTYLNIAKMNEKQYYQVFEKKSMDEHSIKFRETCQQYITKCERIFSELTPFDGKKFRQQFYKKDIIDRSTLSLKSLFDDYIEKATHLKPRSKVHIRMTRNVMETYKSDLTVWDITPDFLKKFEKDRMHDGISQSTIDSLARDIRRVINYYQREKKLIPAEYEYPFGRGGYSVKSFFPKKQVMKNEEIQSVVNFTEFDNAAQEYARDIWLFLYRCNGINFVDLLRMKWSDINNGYIIFFRKKTETTRKNNKKQIVVPVTPKLQQVLNKIGVKDSPFILGKLREGFSDSTFENLRHRMGQEINKNLNEISKKIGLSVPLTMATARDAYATSLMRGHISKDEISSMLGHSNSIVTEHYLDSLDNERTDEINSVLY